MTAKNILVIGAGIGGLTAATLLARSGARVRLVDQAREVGGRARTTVRDEYHLNMGPRALYARGAGAEVLRELGIQFSGHKAEVKGAYALHGDRIHTLPAGLLSLLTTGLMNLTEKVQAGRILSSLSSRTARELARVNYRDWVESVTQAPVVREFLYALARLTTYSNAPHRMSAGAIVAQLSVVGRDGVWYLDGGWQTLVDGLFKAAEGAGVRFEPRTRIDSLEGIDDDAVVIATGPQSAGRLLGCEFQLLPAMAACLDVGLRRLPRKNALFALGIDEPLYYSVHTRYADLAPAGGAVIHVLEYLDPTRSSELGDRDVRSRLETVLDRLQPGWRDEVAVQRFLPSITVSHGMLTAPTGAGDDPLPGRPDVWARDNIFLVGDWVGQEGMLADASFASGRRAARLILGQAEVAAA